MSLGCHLYVVFMSLIDFLHEPQDSESQIHKEETMSYVIKFYEIPNLKKIISHKFVQKVLGAKTVIMRCQGIELA